MSELKLKFESDEDKNNFTTWFADGGEDGFRRFLEMHDKSFYKVDYGFCGFLEMHDKPSYKVDLIFTDDKVSEISFTLE